MSTHVGVGQSGTAALCVSSLVAAWSIYLIDWGPCLPIHVSHQPSFTPTQSHTQPHPSWTILRGDKVEVINGPEKGKQVGSASTVACLLMSIHIQVKCPQRVSLVKYEAWTKNKEHMSSTSSRARS